MQNFTVNVCGQQLKVSSRPYKACGVLIRGRRRTANVPDPHSVCHRLAAPNCRHGVFDGTHSRQDRRPHNEAGDQTCQKQVNKAFLQWFVTQWQPKGFWCISAACKMWIKTCMLIEWIHSGAETSGARLFVDVRVIALSTIISYQLE